MKRFCKQFLALLLVLMMVFSISPIQAAAAKKNVTISKAKKGTVYSIWYKGAKPVKATFSASVKKYKTGVTYGDDTLYDIYNVTLTLNNQKPSGVYAAKAVKEQHAIGQKVYTFQPIITDSKGKALKNIIYNANMDMAKSSNQVILSGKVNGQHYSLYNWRKKDVFKYEISIPQKQKECYIGFAGLRNGQIKTALDQKFTNEKIDYYKAGFGSSKKGYIVIKKVK